MKFRKFGKALLMSALSVGAVLSVTSCVQSYTVGFLYVTGTQTSGTPGTGIISGFKIDHNTGKLSPIHGLPIASGGSYPVRAVLLTGSRFIYVLNQGGQNCTTVQSGCKPNIVQFSVGGNGVLAQQAIYSTNGLNPIRMFTDATGGHLYVLDHDAPDSGNGAVSNSCSLALGANVTTCGDITGFNIDASTGRLSPMLNAQVSSASGTPLTYFPVPANPIDFVLTSGFVLTLSGTPSTGDVVFPYSLSTANGQLTISQNSAQPLSVHQATAIQSAGGHIYVLDNEPLTASELIRGTVTSQSQVLQYTVGTGGALQAINGAVPDTSTQQNPLFLIAETKGTFYYLLNSGTTSNTTTSTSGITGYNIDKTSNQLYEMQDGPWSTGSGPQCLVEDPSSQFIYTANFNDSTVTEMVIDQNTGALAAPKGSAKQNYSLVGPATYCLVNGRTS